MALFKRIIQTVLDGIFPINCLGCGAEGKYVCTECFESCQGRLHFKIISSAYRKTEVLSLTNYTDQLTHNLIHFYKYQCVTQAQETVTQFVQKMYSTIEDDDFKKLIHKALFIPIPLHKSRLKWRGFNQSTTIARTLAKLTEGSIFPLLTRPKKTESQVGKEKEERQKNIQNAFGINRKLQQWVKLHHKLILVDDVITTGSTLKEAIDTLHKRFPRSKISCVTLAHKPLDVEQTAKK